MKVEQTVFDPFQLNGDPFPRFAAHRAASGAALGIPPLPELGATHYLFSHDLASKSLKHRALLQAPTGSYQRVREHMTRDRAFDLLTHSLLLSDPPRHSRLRRPLAEPMTIANSQKLTAAMRQEALALARRSAENGPFDAVRDLAIPLAFWTLGQVLGITMENPWALRNLTSRIAAALDMRVSPPTGDAEIACGELVTWVESILASGEVQPGGLAERMLSEAEAGLWTHDDVVANIVFFVFAGQETVVDSFGNALAALDSFPDQRALLDEGAIDWMLAAHELLRHGAPVIYAGARIAAEDLRLGEVSIKAGEAVVPVLASANRDEAVFHAGDRLDFSQASTMSMTFGAGPHVCLGQHVARVEMAALLESLFEAAPRWRLARDGMVFRDSVVFRGLVAAPVEHDGALMRRV